MDYSDRRYDCLKKRDHPCTPANTRRQLEEWKTVKQNCNVNILEEKRREDEKWRTENAFQVKCDCCTNAVNTQPSLSQDWEAMRSCPKYQFYGSRPLLPSDNQMELRVKSIVDRPGPRDRCREGCPPNKFPSFGVVTHEKGVKMDSKFSREDKSIPYAQDWPRWRVEDHVDSRPHYARHHTKIGLYTTAGPTWIRRGDGSPWGQNSFNWNPWAPEMEVFPYTAPSKDRPSFITKFQMDAQQSNSFANSRNLEHIHIG